MTYTKPQLIEELQNLAKQLGKVPEKSDIEKYGKYSYHPYLDYFGGLRPALMESGLYIPPRILTKEIVLQEILELSKKLNKAPSRDDIKNNCSFTYKQMRKVFDYQDMYKTYALIGLYKAPLTNEDRLKEAKEFAAKRNGECLSAECISATEMLDFKCKFGHTFKTNLNRIKTQDMWCNECNTGGLYERICRTTFEQLFNKRFQKAYFSWLKNSRNNRMEIDGCCEELGLGFEHHGIQHYKKHFKYMKTTRDLLQRQKDDELKVKLCKEHGITIIIIPELITFTPLDELKDLIKNECLKNNIILPEKFDDTIIDFERAHISENEREQERICDIAKSHGGEILGKYIGNRNPVSCKCAAGHEFERTPIDIKRRDWFCPICRKNRGNKITEEQITAGIKMHQAGIGITEIGRTLNCDPCAIFYHIKKTIKSDK